jgi:two-component system KDP operon response regulator KdpE
VTACVLVVDDEPQIRRLLRLALIGAEYSVDDAASGPEALKKLQDRRFDLILLDSRMPEMDGVEVCRRIRPGSEIYIIMISVRDQTRDKVEALDAGADDYICKPFDTAEVLARIRAALRRTRHVRVQDVQTASFGSVRINFATRRVEISNRDVRFTPKEFDLLQYFVTNPNMAIPHARLLQSVWGADRGHQVEYLHVFINQIRKKIEPDPANPRYIITEPWIGYRFAPPADDK